MAKLPEGMNQTRTKNGWGNPVINYDYKGVKIYKSRNGWVIRYEVQMSETGNISADFSYGIDRLAGVPSKVEKYLQDPNYILDIKQGMFLLTEARKTELKNISRERVINEIQSMENYLTKYLQEKDWGKLASMADKMKQFTTRNAWVFEIKEVTV